MHKFSVYTDGCILTEMEWENIAREQKITAKKIKTKFVIKLKKRHCITQIAFKNNSMKRAEMNSTTENICAPWLK